MNAYIVPGILVTERLSASRIQDNVRHAFRPFGGVSQSHQTVIPKRGEFGLQFRDERTVRRSINLCRENIRACCRLRHRVALHANRRSTASFRWPFAWMCAGLLAAHAGSLTNRAARQRIGHGDL
jgi:hypothetical protein